MVTAASTHSRRRVPGRSLNASRTARPSSPSTSHILSPPGKSSLLPTQSQEDGKLLTREVATATPLVGRRAARHRARTEDIGARMEQSAGTVTGAAAGADDAAAGALLKPPVNHAIWPARNSGRRRVLFVQLPALPG
jgi:hypothetical protein